MTPKQAYKIYIDYYRDNIWKWEDISSYLKPTLIDYKEYTYGEFKEKVLTDDKFNDRWGNGCREELKENKDV
jgi:hypothetical protein